MKALLLVDIQNGFCPGGGLAVPRGNEVVPVVNALIASKKYGLIVASQDWHPADHSSFASQHKGKMPFEMGKVSGKKQMLWPDHCVQGTKDAEFHPELNLSGIDYVQRKGENRLIDSYSALKDNSNKSMTGLDIYLWHKAVSAIDICGLATDYCVRFTVEDFGAMMQGIKVRFIENASRGISEEGSLAAINSMKSRGIEIVSV